MPSESRSSGHHPAAQVGFWLLVGFQAFVVVPFVVITLFFAVMGWPHLSPAERNQVFLSAAYPIGLVAAGFLGHASLKREQWLAAYAIGLSPLLLLAFWLPMLATA